MQGSSVQYTIYSISQCWLPDVVTHLLSIVATNPLWYISHQQSNMVRIRDNFGHRIKELKENGPMPRADLVVEIEKMKEDTSMPTK